MSHVEKGTSPPPSKGYREDGTFPRWHDKPFTATPLCMLWQTQRAPGDGRVTFPHRKLGLGQQRVADGRCSPPGRATSWDMPVTPFLCSGSHRARARPRLPVSREPC